MKKFMLLLEAKMAIVMSRNVLFCALSAMISLINPMITHADSQGPNVLHIEISFGGGYYAKSVPAKGWGTEGETRIFKVGKKKDVLIAKYPWYAAHLYLEPADDGIDVVRPGVWARGTEASSDDLAMEFYKNDKWLKRYSNLDLAGDPGNVTRSISHYSVIREYRGFRFENGLTVFGITLIDGRQLDFSADTGEIINPPEAESNHADRYVQTVTVGNNQLLGLKVLNEADDSWNIEVEYNYDPQGEDWANLQAGLLRDGAYVPFTGFVPAQLYAGQHKAVIAMSATGDAPDCFTSDAIEITMYRKKGYAFLPDLAKRVFPYEKSWRHVLSGAAFPETDPGTGFGYGRIRQVRIANETNDLLELAVDYIYDPQGSRFAELAAGTYLDPSSPSHDKQIPVRLKPGFNTATLKIERSLMAPAEYKTDRIRIVITGNFLSDKPEERLFIGETFVYPKTWSQSPIPGSPPPLIGQVLEREGKGSEEVQGKCPGVEKKD